MVRRPAIPSDIQKTILTQLIALFDGVATHYQLVRGETRKKRRVTTGGSSHQKDGNDVGESSHALASAPPIISHTTVGINEVTKALETEIQSKRQTVMIPGTAVNKTRALTGAVFICHADLDTPALVAHLPQLVALCNSTRSENHKIKVVQLPAGAESSLADALGYVRRVSVIALDVRLCRLLS